MSLLIAVLLAAVVTPLAVQAITTRDTDGSGEPGAGTAIGQANPPGHEPVELMTGQVPADAAQQMAALAEPLFPLAVAASKEQGNEPVNPAYSPLSVYLALGLTANGASGQAATQFAALLGEQDAVNQLAAGVMTEYITTEDGPTMAVANSLWLDDSFTVNLAFEGEARAIYRAEVTSLDLQAEGVERINAWVDQKTNHLIAQIIGSPPPDWTASLVNALYFKGTWQQPFVEYDTADLPFVLADGSTIQVPTMYRKVDEVKRFETASAEGVVLPYEGGRFGMLLALPTGGVDQVPWDGQQIAAWLAQTEPVSINVYLPKWESELAVSLTQPLQQLGLVAPFEPGNDLAGIGQPAGFVSDVAHKAVVKVNEDGTEAAAVTDVVMLDSGTDQEIHFDRPFVYAIVDLQTGLPLFIGQVDNPLATP